MATLDLVVLRHWPGFVRQAEICSQAHYRAVDADDGRNADDVISARIPVRRSSPCSPGDRGPGAELAFLLPPAVMTGSRIGIGLRMYSQPRLAGLIVPRTRLLTVRSIDCQGRANLSLPSTRSACFMAS